MKKSKASSIAMVSLGCPRNTVDSEMILGRLSSRGYAVTDLGEADIAMVNTCAFIKDAKTESIDAILDLIELKKQGKLKKIVVCGCLPQRYRFQLRKEFPEVDAFVGRVSLNHGYRRFSLTPRHYAYVKICEGCLNACSYCVVPKIKGRFCSVPVGSVAEQVRALARQGVREINVVGQDITAYGFDLKNGAGLETLLTHIVSQAEGVEWFRLLYLYPTRISERLLDFIAGHPKVCKYIDVPLQHISTRILRLMHRKMSRQQIEKLITWVRKKIPQVAIRTSFIVGFPSETKKEFKELCDFVRQMRFERLGAFMYSREEGTPAARFAGQVPEAVKAERLDELMMLQQGIARSVNRGFLGKTIRVLIDEPWEGGGRLGTPGTLLYLGRSQHDAPEVDGRVRLDGAGVLRVGDIVRARVTAADAYDLRAVVPA